MLDPLKTLVTLSEGVAVVPAVREGVAVSHTCLVTGRIGSRNRCNSVVVVCVGGQLLCAVEHVSHVPRETAVTFPRAVEAVLYEASCCVAALLEGGLRSVQGSAEIRVDTIRSVDRHCGISNSSQIV